MQLCVASKISISTLIPALVLDLALHAYIKSSMLTMAELTKSVRATRMHARPSRGAKPEHYSRVIIVAPLSYHLAATNSTIARYHRVSSIKTQV